MLLVFAKTICFAQSNFLICYKIIDKTKYDDIVSTFSTIPCEYYLYSIQGNGKAINFYSSKKILNEESLFEKLENEGFMFFNIDSEYKVIYEPSKNTKWTKQGLRQCTFLKYEIDGQKILDFSCTKNKLIDEFSDTIEAFSTDKLPKECSFIFSKNINNPILKIVAKDYEISPEYIKKIEFPFTKFETFIPANLTLRADSYRFVFQGSSEFPIKGQKINPFSVWGDNYPVFDLENKKHFKTTIIYFTRGFYDEDTSDSRKTLLMRNYQEEMKTNIGVIIKATTNIDSVSSVFVTTEAKNIVDNDSAYNFLRNYKNLKVIASANSLLQFYHINTTPEIFIITNERTVKDIYSTHFFSDDLTLKEFIKKQLN